MPGIQDVYPVHIWVGKPIFRGRGVLEDTGEEEVAGGYHWGVVVLSYGLVLFVRWELVSSKCENEY
jgi:hypothetical protein